jgi:hypothetical protein
MSKVVCVGCSFTAGTKPNNPNWVRSLSKLHPEHEFHNLALAGSSLLYSIWILEEFLKYNKPDLIIFQITNEGRLTYYKDDDIDRRGTFSFMNSEGNYNYIFFPYNLVSCVHYGTLGKDRSCGHPLIDEQQQIAKLYYTHLSRKKIFEVEHRALVTHVKKISDVCFYHNDREDNDTDIISIEKSLGTTRFRSFVEDDGDHFGQSGSDWQAEFISNNYMSKLK